MTAPSPALAFHQLAELQRITPGTGTSTTLSQLWSQLRTDFKGVIKSTPFILLTIIGLLNCVPSFRFATEGYGTSNLPVTYTMVDMIRGAFYLFIIAILTYFTGALVWKERTAKVNEIYDALPTRTWTGYAAKFGTIVSVAFLLNLVAIIAAVCSQSLMGYYRFELGVYVRELLLLDMLGFAFLTALFKARPSPFYVLDEVEAALDEVNLGRLIDIIEELRASSQLIVITHQKRTMEIADALYGVSMRGDGVTQVIGQRLRESDQVSA